jgi:hypothetical protein
MTTAEREIMSFIEKNQRAMVAEKLANMPHGGNRKNQAEKFPLDNAPPITQSEAADQLKISKSNFRLWFHKKNRPDDSIRESSGQDKTTSLTEDIVPSWNEKTTLTKTHSSTSLRGGK